MSAGVVIARTAAAVFSSDKGRKAVGWIAVAVVTPLVLLIALLCSVGVGSAAHNNAAVDACFYGGGFTEQMPDEYRGHVTDMQTAFSVLDTSIAAVNAEMEEGSLDPVRIKAVFYALCFGEEAPSRRAANRFVECFYTTEKRTDDGGEAYTVAVPLPLSEAYINLAAELGREITEDDMKNIAYIYERIAGAADAGSGSGAYERGGGYGTEIDVSGFVDPGRKNAADNPRISAQIR